MKKINKMLVLFLGLLFLAGCAHLTPEQKQEQGQALYNKAEARLAANRRAPEFKEQLKLAVDELKEADELGYAPAAGSLAAIYSDLELSSSLNISQEERWQNYRTYLQRAAEGNVLERQAELGRNYYQGVKGFTKDSDKAVYWWEKAANSGDIKAVQSLIEYYGHNSCAQCPEKYVYWMEKMADSGSLRAMLQVGLGYEKGNPPFSQDYDKAFYWFTRAMDKGGNLGFHYLGHMYLYGHGVKQDYTKARELMEKAAAFEDWGGAHHHLGELYYYGLGVKRNYNEAFLNYKIGAEQGYYGSMYMVGYMYLKGQGVKASRAEAKRWYELAVSSEGDDGYNNDQYLLPAKNALHKAFGK